MVHLRAGGVLALTALLALGGCGDRAGDEPVAEHVQAILGGNDDTGDQLRHVVALVKPGSGVNCSGVLIGSSLGSRIVLTAAHCVEEYVVGCSAEEGEIVFEYEQPAPGDPSWINPSSPYVVVMDPGEVSPLTGTHYDVEAIQVMPAFLPRVRETCCQGTACALCDEAWSRSYVHDFALLYLEEPVLDVMPVPVLTAALPPSFPYSVPHKGLFPIDLPGLVGTDVVLAGASLSDASVSNIDPHRAFGVAEVATLAFSSGTDPKKCDEGGQSWTETESCSACRLTTNRPACVIGGDSGGPTFLNQTDLGGTSVPGLPYPVVGAIHSTGNAYTSFDSNGIPICDSTAGENKDAATWNALGSFDGVELPTAVGSWLRVHMLDFDGDKWPNEADNCPYTPQKTQANCNLDAEIAFGYPKRGDACDPIPCPSASVKKRRVTTTDSQPISGSVFQVLTKTFDLEDFRVTPQTSKQFGNGSNLGDERDGLVLGNVATKYRFCQIDSTVQVLCKAEDVISDVVDDPELPPGQGQPWHAVSIWSTTGPFAEEQLPYDNALPTFDRIWDFESDSNAWESTGLITPVSALWDTNLEGRFWAHAASAAGSVAALSSTGYRTKVDGTTSSDDENLPNRSYAIDVDGVTSFDSIVGPLIPDPYFEWKICDPLGPVWDGVNDEASTLLRLPEDHVGMLLRTGEVAVVDDLFGANLFAMMIDSASWVWANAVEPSADMAPGGSVDGIHALVLDPSAPAIVDAVVRTGGIAGNVADVGMGSLALPDGPGSRTGYVPVYSRTSERLFIVGGLSGRTYTGEIWMRGVGDGFGWLQVPLSGYAPGKVLAATWDASAERLWVLDEVGTQARLYRISPYIGHAEHVASWPRTSAWNRVWLKIDPSGGVLLISSNDTTGEHAVARLHVDPWLPGAPVTVTHYEEREFALALEPTVDMKGYTFVHTTGDGFAVDRLEALPGGPIGLADLDAIL